MMLFVSVQDYNSVDDIIFVGLTVVQVTGEDLGTNVPSGVRCPERLLPGLPYEYHFLHPYGFSGSFGGMFSPTQPLGWTFQ